MGLKAVGTPSYNAISNTPGSPNYRPVAACLGDSITANMQDTNTGRAYNESRGWFHWFQVFTGHRFYFPVPGSGDTGNNFGVSGNTTVDIIARLDAVIAKALLSGTSIVYVHIATNDANDTTINLDTVTLPNLNTIYTRLQAVGMKVVAVLVLPRQWSSSQRRLRSWKINRYIKNWNLNNPTSQQIRVLDFTNAIIDATNSTGDPGTSTGDGNTLGTTVDYLHPAVAGSFYMGKIAAAAEDPYLPPYPYLQFMSPADIYDATENPTGNLLTNGMMTSTGGTQTVGSGTLAANWTTNRKSGSTIALVNSKGATQLDGTPGSHQILAVSTNSTGAAGEIIRLTQTLSSNFSAGDVVEAVCEYYVSGITGSNLEGITLNCKAIGDTTVEGRDMDIFDATNAIPAEIWSGVLCTQRITVTANPTSLIFELLVVMDGTKTGTVNVAVGRATMRKVA